MSSINIPHPSEALAGTLPASTKWYQFFEAWKRRNEETTASWSATVTASSGTITTASADAEYTKRGRLVWFSAFVTITTNGTGTGVVNVTLPFTPDRNAVGFGLNNSNVGLICFIQTSGVVSLYNLDGSYPGADGYELLANGLYRIAE